MNSAKSNINQGGGPTALIGILCVAFLANTALSVSYASLIEALSGSTGASTRTALLLNMWAFALIFCSHRYPALLRDKGTRACAAGSLLLSGAAIALLALTSSFTVWLLAEVAQGIAFGLFYVAVETWINNAVEDSIRNRMNSLYLAVQSLGFAIGPIVITAGGFGTVASFGIAASTMCAASICAWMLVPEIHQCEAKHQPLGWRQFIDITKQLPWVAILGVLTGALDNAAWSLLVPYLRNVGYSDSVSLLALTVFVWGQVMLLMPLGYLADKVGELRVMKAVAAFIVVYSLILIQAEHVPTWLMMAMTFIFGPACFSIYGAALSVASKRVSRSLLSLASAVLVTGWCMGGFVGSILVGLGMDMLDSQAFPGALFVLAAGVTAVISWLIPAGVATAAVRGRNATPRAGGATRYS